MLDFDSVQTVLEGLGSNVDAAESHGTLCALLIDNAGLATWLGHTLEEFPDGQDVLARERIVLLEQLYELTRDQMNLPELGLELLLPDESDDFGLRLLGLASWCQGFLYGIGICGITESRTVDKEAEECLSDLLEISKLSHSEQSSDEAEQQFAEISEHVRMATLMLNDSLNPLKPASTVH